MVSVLDWGMLGYLTGAQVEEDIPVLTGIEAPAGLIRHKHFGAAASGGVEMYHAAGMTPEADTEEQAFGSKKPVQDLHYGPRERRRTYDTINGNAHATDVDYIMLGWPRYTIERIWEAARLLDGKRGSENCALWIFTAAAVKDVADRNGYTKIIEDAGGVMLADTCRRWRRRCPREPGWRPRILRNKPITCRRSPASKPGSARPGTALKRRSPANGRAKRPN